MTLLEFTHILTQHAEEKFGRERANELGPEIELMAADLLKLAAAAVGEEDEP